MDAASLMYCGLGAPEDPQKMAVLEALSLSAT